MTGCLSGNPASRGSPRRQDGTWSWAVSCCSGPLRASDPGYSPGYERRLGKPPWRRSRGAGIGKAERNPLRSNPIIDWSWPDETDDRFLGISARRTSRHSPRRVRLLCALSGREVPGAMWHGPYRTYMEALQKLKEIGHKKRAQLNCRYCNPQYGPRQWDAEA